ncbi:MAG: HAMP domain-containing histidine kinase [Bacteroidaceae bacterium]|nr:HAMP domain-containing histidine kinase [Bacteroidaceae bacterium]
MRKNLINIVAIFGLVATIIIQLVWLYHSFVFVRNEVSLQASILLDRALWEETLSRCYSLPPNTQIDGKTEDDIKEDFAEYVYMQQSLENEGFPFKLDSIGLIGNRLLNEKGYTAKFRLYEFRDSVLVKSFDEANISLLDVEIKDFPMRKDYTVYITGRLTNTEGLYMEKMGMLLFSTFLLMIFAIGCLVFQIKTIRWQKQVLKMREDFSYAIIHDMKTPLSSIAMVLNFLRSGRLEGKPEMKEKYCRIAEEETEHLLNLTNKVLTISKLEAHKMVMNKTMTELQPIVERLVDKFKTNASKPVNFTIDLKETDVYADAEYLEEVLRNLVDNSMKYSNEEVHIKISSRIEKGYTVISVYDDGTGISYKDQQVIFNKYERGSVVEGKRKGGFGLGLNLVWQVVEAHGGKVMVNSLKGEFTEFSLYLPNQNMKEYD